MRKLCGNSFAAYGIDRSKGKEVPTSRSDSGGPAPTAGQTVAPEKIEARGERTEEAQPSEPGAWPPTSGLALSYERTHFEPMVREADEVFRLHWENRKPLKL